MPARIPICHVQLLPLMSGIQRLTLQILDVLDLDRFEPHVVMQEPGPFSEELERRGIRCHFLPNLVRPLNPYRDLRAYFDLKSLFRRQGYQIVHSHCSKPGILARIAARRAGVPVVIHHVQSFAWHEFSKTPVRWAYKTCERIAAPYGDRVIFVNHDDRADAIQSRIVPATKSPLIYNGTDLSLFKPSFTPRTASPLRNSIGLAPEGALIYFVARLEKPKQPWLIPEIAAELQRLVPDQPWKIVVAGEGSYRRSVEAKIAELKLEDRVTLLGWQSEEDKYRTYHEADAVLQPSLYEGLSLTLIEAQAAGLPSVAGSVKGNREVVVPGTGFLCEARSANDYAAKLAVLVRDPELRRAQGRAARAHAEREFDVDQNMRQITRLYEELLVEKAVIPAPLARPTEQPRRAA
jgi:glycosyltransferase involved in cell wall biosynthesis